MSVLKVTDLHVSVETEQGTKQILKGVDLTINEGEIHAIMGPNGSGKSTSRTRSPGIRSTTSRAARSRSTAQRCSR